ncbi:hypothetical protein Tco_0676026 [Tanacetum coccineum]
MVAYLHKSEGSEGFHQIVDFLTASHIRYALTKSLTNYVSLIEQFWQTATASTPENGDMEITATIDGKVKVVSEASIRRHLKLEDSDGISDLPTTEIFKQLALISPRWRFLIHTILHYLSSKKTAWEQFSSNIMFKDILGLETPLFQTSLFRKLGSSAPSSPTTDHVADDLAALTGHSGNINKTPAMPHDSPLLRVHTLGSDEDRMQHNELMDLVTKLLDRVVSLETNLQQTKKVYVVAYTKLIKKVKWLEDKLNKSRRKRRLVLLEEEDSDIEILAQEDPSK